MPLPQLYAAAGARFAFDADTLRSAVNLMEETVARLEDSQWPLADSSRMEDPPSALSHAKRP